jgi:ABC-type Zn uptake system ZnuABC Zn-binding protein ZnuA
MLGTILIFNKRTGIRVMSAFVAVALVLGACSDGDSGAPDGLTIVATTSIAGDLVSQIVGERATVEVLMPPGTDPHDFQPSSQQAAALRSADLVVAWGLGLEEGLEDVLASAEDDGVRVVELSTEVDPLAYDEEDAEDHEDEDQADEDHGHGLDPHTWTDPVRMAEAARIIGLALADVAPDGDWTVAAEPVAEEMLAVHDQVDEILAVIPSDRRKLVTNHDSFGYFAARYDFEVVGVAIRGGSTLASPSSAQIAELVDAIRRAGVTVLFAETSSPDALLEAVAGEVEGVRIVEILEGSLAPSGEPGDTLAGMLVHNAEVIANALGSG